MNWAQLQTVLWLRTRLVLNQWTRGGGLGAVLAIVMLVASGFTGGMLFFGGLAAGKFLFQTASAQVFMFTWAGLTMAFLMFWGVGLMTELQRTESIDLQRLLHLPVLLGQLFVINYLASHFALSVILTVPAMLGLALGLAWERGPAMLLLIPLALSMVFMITAWTYCLRGWLAGLMSNPRRRRNILMGITLGMIVLAQTPNFYFNVIARSQRATTARTPEEAKHQAELRRAADQKLLQQLTNAQQFLPPFWVSVGAQGLAEGHLVPALLGTLGCCALGVAGIYRAYRGTVRFYRGEVGGQAPVAAPTVPSGPAPVPDGFMERQFPGVPEQAAALALATFRSLLRAPEVRMGLASSIVIFVIMFSTMLTGRAPNVPVAGQSFVVTFMAGLSVFMIFQFVGNQFGHDRAGFRALVLSPADRRLLLLGKNLAFLPIASGLGILLITVTTIYLALPPTLFAAGLLQLATALLLSFTVGNFLSIVAPYRIQPGSMKPTKLPAAAMLLMVLSQMLFPFALAPTFVPPAAEWCWRQADGAEWVPVNLLLSILFAGAAATIYWSTLTPLARMLHRRETKILGLLTAEVE